MKKDRLIQEFENLKIENARTIVGGQQGGEWTYQDYWVMTNGSSGVPGDFHMDKKKLKFWDPDFGNDTIPISNDTISNP